MPEFKDLKETRYLGDGVYAGLYSGILWLCTYDGYRITNIIALEQEVLVEFNHYVGDLNKSR